MRIFFLIISSLWYLMWVYTSVGAVISVKTWVSGTGKVVGHDLGNNKRKKNFRSKGCVAIIEYKDRNFSVHEFKTRVGTKPCPFKKGEVFPILYSDSNPEKAVLNTKRELFSASIGSFSVATLALFLGIWGPRLAVKVKRIWTGESGEKKPGPRPSS